MQTKTVRTRLGLAAVLAKPHTHSNWGSTCRLQYTRPLHAACASRQSLTWILLESHEAGASPWVALDCAAWENVRCILHASGPYHQLNTALPILSDVRFAHFGQCDWSFWASRSQARLARIVRVAPRDGVRVFRVRVISRTRNERNCHERCFAERVA